MANVALSLQQECIGQGYQIETLTKMSKFVFAGALDNFWTIFGPFSALFRRFVMILFFWAIQPRCGQPMARALWPHFA